MTDSELSFADVGLPRSVSTACDGIGLYFFARVVVIHFGFGTAEGIEL